MLAAARKPGTGRREPEADSASPCVAKPSFAEQREEKVSDTLAVRVSDTFSSLRLACGRAPRGVSLIELLVVISIMVLLMAIGAGVWLAFRNSSTEREAYAQLAASARRARVFALEESSASRLILDRTAGAFHSEGMRLLGLWHLEGDPTNPRQLGPEVGFAGRRLFNSGGVGAPGYRGLGLRFASSGTLTMADEDLKFPAGGQLSCYLFTEKDSAAAQQNQGLFTRGKGLQLFINVKGELEARSGSAVIVTEGYRLALQRWSLVTFDFGPEELRIAVDGVLRARSAPGDLPSRKEEGLPLVFGDAGAHGFPYLGTVDEIVVRRMVREGQYRLRNDLKLDAPVGEVRFDAAGMLDRRFHPGPVRMGIRRKDPAAPGGEVTRWVTVGLDGEIRED